MSLGRTALLHRRAILGTGAAALACPALAAPTAFETLEARLRGGRLGVFAVNTRTGRSLAHRADERFATASSFKGLLAGAVLARVDAGQERLDRRISYSKADLLSHAPVTEAHLLEGGLPVEALCAAAVEVSDNTAANLLLASIGGPASLTAWLRSIGDRTTRLDRNEPTLNTAIKGDPRDTTTPRAMARTYQSLLLGAALRPTSQARLADWMQRATPGLNRLRKDLPPGWRAGDKSGTGENGAVGDVAIFWPPNGAPILTACYTHLGASDLEVREAVMADIGAHVARALI